MNQLLLYDEDFVGDDTVRIDGARADGVRRILADKEREGGGEGLRVGRLDGNRGHAEVREDRADELLLRVTLNEAPPPRPGIDLLLAAPRPKQLKRILPALASMGVDEIVLMNAARVEKSYFDSKALETASIHRLFDLGLEQGCDTIRPRLRIARRFRPFVEDELDSFRAKGARIVAHPGGADDALHAARSETRLILAVGPEGGWVPFELELLQSRGFSVASLGSRPLRTEIAVAALIGASGRLQRP